MRKYKRFAKDRSDLIVMAAFVPNMKEAFQANNKENPKAKLWHVNHARAKDFKRALGEEDYNSYFSFANVRNPWTRLGSTYHYVRGNPANPKSEIAQKQTLDEFIAHRVKSNPSIQSNWVTDAEGNLIVNRIIKMESFTEDMDILSKEIFGRSYPIPHVNASKNTKANLVFKPETIDLVRKVYEKDFKLLGYPDLPPGYED